MYVGGLGESICEWAGEMLAGSFEKLASIGDNVLSVVQGIDGDTQLSIVSTQVHGIVSGTAIPALQGVGYAIALLFFILGLIDLLRNDRLTTEMYIKFFINLFVAVFFIYQSPNLYTAVIKFGDGLGNACANIFSSGASWIPPSAEEITEHIIYFAELPKDDPNHKHWIETLLLTLIAGGPIYIVCTVLVGVTYLIAFSRLIELAVRGAFLPIGFALLSDDGFKGAGGRYFRKFIAICAQVAALVMISGITTMIIGTVGQNITTTLLTGGTHVGILEIVGKLVVVVGAAIACISVMFKSIGLINDAFGA